MAIFFSYLDFFFFLKKTGFELELSEEGLSLFSRVIASLLLSCYFPSLSGSCQSSDLFPHWGSYYHFSDINPSCITELT